jgi:hypothetical protein
MVREANRRLVVSAGPLSSTALHSPTAIVNELFREAHGGGTSIESGIEALAAEVAGESAGESADGIAQGKTWTTSELGQEGQEGQEMTQAEERGQQERVGGAAGTPLIDSTIDPTISTGSLSTGSLSTGTSFQSPTAIVNESFHRHVKGEGLSMKFTLTRQETPRRLPLRRRSLLCQETST